MNILRDVGSGLLKMFVGDAWLTLGVLAVVMLTGSLTASGAVQPLLGGTLLFLGCNVVLVGSVALHVRRERAR